MKISRKKVLCERKTIDRRDRESAMNTFQTLVSLVLIIFVLSVIVQAIQESAKALLSTKANVMEQTLIKFMGNHLTLPQVKDALNARGLDITALENFNKEDFRHLLDAIPFENAQLQGVVNSAQATADQVKDNIAASYEAARALFQQAYTRRNKLFVVAFSLFVAGILNANPIILYEQISADQVAQQAIIGKAVAVESDKSANETSAQRDIGAAYSSSRSQIVAALRSYPILMRTNFYKQDLQDHPYTEVPGLLIMGLLVSLGAPFWNDVLKSMMGLNTALNANGNKTS